MAFLGYARRQGWPERFKPILLKDGEDDRRIGHIRAAGRPVNVGKEGVESGRLAHREQPSDSRSRVLEPMSLTSRRMDRATGPSIDPLALNLKDEFALQHIEGLVFAPVTMQGRPALRSNLSF